METYVSVKQYNENEAILIVDGSCFIIPIEIKEFLDRMGLDKVEVSVNKNGVESLKIKSLTYKEATVNKDTVLNIYKNRQKVSVENNFINNSKGVIKMKVSVRFMKSKNGKKSFFESFCRKEVVPKLLETTLTTVDEVKEKLQTIVDGLSNDRSSWTIEKNTKSEGFVVKNTFTHKNKETGEDYDTHSIFFVNIYENDATAE